LPNKLPNAPPLPPFWLPSTLSVARVLRVLVLLLVVELDWGDKALASASVVSVFMPLPLPPPFDEPPRPPFTAKSVAAGEFPSELITTASVVDICLLSSIATAAKGFTVPLVTPLSKISFLSGSS